MIDISVISTFLPAEEWLHAPLFLPNGEQNAELISFRRFQDQVTPTDNLVHT